MTKHNQKTHLEDTTYLHSNKTHFRKETIMIYIIYSGDFPWNRVHGTNLDVFTGCLDLRRMACHKCAPNFVLIHRHTHNAINNMLSVLLVGSTLELVVIALGMQGSSQFMATVWWVQVKNPPFTNESTTHKQKGESEVISYWRMTWPRLIIGHLNPKNTFQIYEFQVISYKSERNLGKVMILLWVTT